MGVAEKYYFSNALPVGVTLMQKYFSKMKASLLGNYFHFLSFFMYVTFITSSRRWIRKWLNRERRISSLVIPKTNKSQSTPAGSSFHCCNCFLELLDALALQHNHFVFDWPRDTSSTNLRISWYWYPTPLQPRTFSNYTITMYSAMEPGWIKYHSRIMFFVGH